MELDKLVARVKGKLLKASRCSYCRTKLAPGTPVTMTKWLRAGKVRFTCICQECLS
jgi:hypothetical protein